jgi:hypothetical protein
MSETESDTAMASGSDAGEPGRGADSRPLRPDEQDLREALERDAGPAEDDEGFPEVTEAAGRAADDETPLPGRGGPQDDGLAPKFEAPGE